MSHTITFTVAKTDDYINQCQDLINKAENWQHYFQEKQVAFDCNELLAELKNLKFRLESVNGQSIPTTELHQISTLAKEVTNLSFSNLTKQICSVNRAYLSGQTFHWEKMVQKYGALAVNVLQKMATNNLPLNETNFNETLEQLYQQQANQQILAETQKIADERLQQIPFPKLRQLLKTQINRLQTNQEVSDLLPFIDDKINEIKHLTNWKKDVIAGLPGFKIVLDNIWQLNNGLPTLAFMVRNQQNNEVQIVLHGDGRMEFKLGNYVGHLCDQTSEKLIDILKSKGYTISNVHLSRRTGNEIPRWLAERMME